MEKLEGATTALITPLSSQGKVQWRDLVRLVEYQVENGIHGIVSCGTTGQSPTLSWEEHQLINQAVAKVAKGKVSLIFGAGSNNTGEAEEATLKAWLEGADATLHVTGYYNAPSQAGIYDYFSTVAEAAPIPVIMYDVRGRGHPPIMPATRIKLARAHSNIVGVKEASGKENAADWKQTRTLAREHGLDRHSFKIISGDDPNTYEMITSPDVEGVGVISVWSNILPHVYAREVTLLLKGEMEEAKAIENSLKGLNGIVGVRVAQQMTIEGASYSITDSFRNPEPVQFAAYLLGITESPLLRSPMGFLPKEGQAVVGKVLLELYQRNPKYFKPIEECFGVDVGARLNPYKEAP